MPRKELKQDFRKSASKLHQSVGRSLRACPITKGLKIYQEWPMENSRYHVDWFLPDLKIAIECHGEQHERPVAFDGDEEAAKERFVSQQIRDKDKEDIAKEMGWRLVVIWYWEKVDENLISQKIAEVLGV